MIFTMLDNDVLVNNISLLYIKLNEDKKAIEYVLANGKKTIEKYDTLQEMYTEYQGISTNCLIQLMDGYLLNARRIETIEHPKYDKTRIEYGFGTLGKISEKYNTEKEAEDAFKEIAKDNYIKIEDNYYVSILTIDGLQKDSVNNEAVAYTLTNGKVVKAFYESSEAADKALDNTITKLETFQYVAPEADTREYLKIVSADKTEGGDNTEEYYKNMDLITITNTDNVINVTAISPLNEFKNAVGMRNAWYGILVDLGIPRSKVVALKGYSFDSKELNDNEAKKWGATNDNQFVLWLTGNQYQEYREMIFGANDDSVKPTSITIQFVVDPNFKREETKRDITTLDELKEAMSDSSIKTVNLKADIENINETITFENKVTFNGNGHKLGFAKTGQNLVFLQVSEINNVNVVAQGTDEWTSTYAMQVYNGEGYSISNSSFTGGNGGLLINGATATIENVNVSGNTFGGIEVSKGAAASKNSILYVEGTLTNDTEEYGKPTIWTDGEGQTVIGADSMFTNSEIKEGQVQYYLVEENSKKEVVPEGILVNGVDYDTLADAIATVPDGILTDMTLYKDIAVEEAVEIPENKNIVLDLNGHTITGQNFSANGRILTNKGTLTIDGEGTISSASQGIKGTGAINNEGELVVNSGEFSGGNGANGAAVNNKAGATMTVNGGTFNGCPRGIQNLATLTINDGTFIGSDTYSGNEGNGVICGPSSNTTIKGGTFIGHMNGLSVMDNAEATVKIEGGTFKTDGYESSGAIYNGLGNTIIIDDCEAITEGDSGCTFVNKGIATVNGGTFQGDNTNAQVYTVDSGQGASSKATIELGSNVSAYGTFGALRVTSGTATVKGGTYKVTESNGTPYYALYVSSASGDVTVDVENGTFESPNAAAMCGESLYSFNDVCKLNIENGTFTSPEEKEVIKQETPGVVTITGGNYSSNVEDFVAEGYEIAENEGRFVVNEIQ